MQLWQHAAHATNQLLLAAKQEPYKKAYLPYKKAYFLLKNTEEFLEKEIGRMDH